MTIISSMGGCGSTSFISWFGERIDCNCPFNSEGLRKVGPGSNTKGFKHRQRPPKNDDPYLAPGKHIERALFLFDSPYDVIPSLFRRKIAVGHAIAITGMRPDHGNDLDKFLAAGIDSFGFGLQFHNWTDTNIELEYPRLAVRSSLIWSHLVEICDFLGIAASQIARFPPKAERKSSFGGLSPAQQATMKAVYGPLDGRINRESNLVLICARSIVSDLEGAVL